MENQQNSKRLTSRMIVVFLTLGFLSLWFVSTQFEALPVGTKPLFPERMLSISGENLQTQAWRGKPLVVNFWGTWCPPCVSETPGLVNVSKKFMGRVNFVGIAVESPLQDLHSFQARFQIPYPIVVGNYEMINAWKADHLPMTYLLNSALEVVWSHRGAVSESELTKAINNLM